MSYPSNQFLHSGKVQAYHCNLLNIPPFEIVLSRGRDLGTTTLVIKAIVELKSNTVLNGSPSTIYEEEQQQARAARATLFSV